VDATMPALRSLSKRTLSNARHCGAADYDTELRAGRRAADDQRTQNHDHAHSQPDDVLRLLGDVRAASCEETCRRAHRRAGRQERSPPMPSALITHHSGQSIAPPPRSGRRSAPEPFIQNPSERPDHLAWRRWPEEIPSAYDLLRRAESVIDISQMSRPSHLVSAIVRTNRAGYVVAIERESACIAAVTCWPPRSVARRAMSRPARVPRRRATPPPATRAARPIHRRYRGEGNRASPVNCRSASPEGQDPFCRWGRVRANTPSPGRASQSRPRGRWGCSRQRFRHRAVIG